MNLPIAIDFPPMEAELTHQLPAGSEWGYEPKWDGFRCLIFKDGDDIDLRSKSGKPLGRYFPDLVEVIASLGLRRFVLDGEIVVPSDGALVFDELLLRMHPAATRVARLAADHPAHLILFDLLVNARGTNLTTRPFTARRTALEKLHQASLRTVGSVHLSPLTHDVELARSWLSEAHGGLDGVMAKRLDLHYASGDRTAMKKVKKKRTADCVVGGYRLSSGGDLIGSLLLGLHDDGGLLHHVGFCSAFSKDLRKQVTDAVIPLSGGEGFSGRAPTTTSRWRTQGSGEWNPVSPTLVVEVEYDHFSGGRFRHGTRFLRWRPDKDPGMCTLDQLEKEGSSALGML
jgi:ATP-dependent DNA ligase